MSTSYGKTPTLSHEDALRKEQNLRASSCDNVDVFHRLHRLTSFQLFHFLARGDSFEEQIKHEGMERQSQIIRAYQHQQTVERVDHHSHDKGPVEELLSQNAENHEKTGHHQCEDEADDFRGGSRLKRHRVGDAGDAKAEDKAPVSAGNRDNRIYH